MPLELITKSSSLADLSSLPPFEFSDSVACFVFGLTGFDLRTVAEEGQNVLTLEVILSADYSGNSVTVTATANLEDKQGRGPDTGSSWVTVCVAAWVGNNPGSVTLANTPKADSSEAVSGASQPIGYTCVNPYASLPVVSGFSLKYSPDDHQLNEVSGSTALDGTAGVIPSAAMSETGNTASGTACGGLVAAVQGCGFLIMQGTYQTTLPDTCQVDFGMQLADCAVFLKSWTAAYESNNSHDISEISAGLTAADQAGVPFINADQPTVVRLTTPRAYLWNGGNENQDDTKSSVEIVVIGIPSEALTAVTQAIDPAEVTSSSAELRGAVNAYGPNTTIQFHYSPGPGTDVSATVTVPDASAPASGVWPVPYQATITGLKPGTKYTYYISASNLSGVSTGAPQYFTTPAA